VAGVEFVPFSWDRDDEIRRAHNAAFTEHHGSAERDPQSWQAMFTGTRAFRPELSVLAVEDGAVVGYVLAYVYEADSAATGVRETHLGQIGVLPRARGRGLASALIAAALRIGAEHGCERAGLEVDTDNVTGALRLYEKLGFSTTRLRVSWSRSLREVSGGSR
jgi:ribosomal protein S18 acetylase RimI-like enzyme